MAQFPAEQSRHGEFKRQEDAFRDWVKRDGSTPYRPERDRYHLYVSLACPWAHRTIILRKLKGLEEVVGMTVADPVRDERGWAGGVNAPATTSPKPRTSFGNGAGTERYGSRRQTYSATATRPPRCAARADILGFTAAGAPPHSFAS